MAADQVLNNVVQTLINVSGGTEIGTTLPPKQNGQFRVPFVKNLRLGPQSSYFGGTQFTLLWDEPSTTENISHYNVFTVGELSNNKAPLGPYSAVTSPAIFRVTPSSTGVITFFVQTQLHNGNCSEIASSPSVTATVTAPVLKTEDFGPAIVLPNYGALTEPALTDYAVNSSVDTVGHLPPAILLCDSTAAPFTVFIPGNIAGYLAYSGQLLTITKTDTSANAVTVDPGVGNFIDGAANYVLAGGAKHSVTIVWGSIPGFIAQWYVINKY